MLRDFAEVLGSVALVVLGAALALACAAALVILLTGDPPDGGEEGP